MKRNLFVRRVECWECHEKFHLLIITKYNGVLCKKCYKDKHENMLSLFHDFIASFEVEYDTDFKEDTKTLHDVIEMIYAYYEGSCYHLEQDQPKVEYKDVVNQAREVYLEVKEFDTKISEGNDNEDR